MQWNSMLGEYTEYKQLGKKCDIDWINCRDEDGLLGEPIYDNKDGIETRGGWEFLNEVHGNGIPRMFWDWELLKESIGAMSEALSTYK